MADDVAPTPGKPTRADVGEAPEEPSRAEVLAAVQGCFEEENRRLRPWARIPVIVAAFLGAGAAAAWVSIGGLLDGADAALIIMMGGLLLLVLPLTGVAVMQRGNAHERLRRRVLGARLEKQEIQALEQWIKMSALPFLGQEVLLRKIWTWAAEIHNKSGAAR